MDYNRKELVDWVRGIYQNLDEADKQDALRFFPELRESEDKRIIQFFAELATDACGGPGQEYYEELGLNYDKVMAWLEKQKENPKSADPIPANCASSVKCEDSWHKTANSLPNNGRDVLAKDALGNYLLASFDGAQWFVSVYDEEDHPVLHTPPILEWCDIPSEKQKEKNPALVPERIFPKFAVGDTICRPMWSDHTIQEIYIHCNDPVYVCVNEDGTESHIPMSEQDEWEQKEQKPAGWSEEEERILKGIIGKINHDQNYGVSKAEMLSFLKRLRPSWKPNGISMVEDGS